MTTMTLPKREDLITPQTIRSKYSWLNQRGLPMVIHNDLDGLLTGLILKNELGWEVAGVYDLKNLYFDKNYDLSPTDAIYVDLDVTHKDYRSLGHHIIGKEDGDQLNINRLFGIDNKKYRQKYPLSTAVFLYWLFEKDFSKESVLAQLFLLHSDSVWKNYLDYTNNVTTWFERLNLNDMLNFLENPRMIPSVRKYVLPNTNNWNNQCGFDIRKGKLVFKDKKETKSLQEYMDALAKTFNMETVQLPEEFTTHTRFKRQEVKIKNRNLENALASIEAESNVFSYSLKYWDTLDISYT